MATSELARPPVLSGSPAQARESAQISELRYFVTRALQFLASLRLTVFLFALAIFLVFVGTLAQVDNDVWEVVRHTYFRVWFAWVELQTFERFAQLFSKDISWNLSGGFFFPGGKLIGLALLINLVAAHAVRFKIAATGARLWAGLATIAAGIAITFFVIQTGMDQAIESEISPALASALWQSLRAALAIAALAGLYFLVANFHRMRRAEWCALLTIDILLASLAIWLLVTPDARLDYSGLRILWQLVKGTAAGLVLLVGCVMVFRKRAGIVLLHGGIALMMLSELLTAMSAHESQMTIAEGAASNWSQDIRASELAVVDHSDPKVDRHTVVPEALLASNVGRNERIDLPDLPFTLQVHRWLENSSIAAPSQTTPNPASAGIGLKAVAQSRTAATGVDGGDNVDLASAYVELFSRKTGESLGTYLVSQHLPEQAIEVDGKNYDLALRFQRTYYPFSVELQDFRFDKYVGTSTAKNYSSDVILRDPQRNVERPLKIWMNNPLRYAGLTFYQSGFDDRTEETTILQVVRNPGWMTPYVACMLVGIGMLAHFGSMLVRFLKRRAEETNLANQRQQTSSLASTANARSKGWLSAPILLPALVLLIFGGYLFSKTRMPSSPPNEMQIYEFGKLPLAYQGRVKPYDTVARNALQILSGRQEIIVEGKEDAAGGLFRRQEKIPAIRWLLDVISGAPQAVDHRVFRIESPELLETLGLEPRPGSFRYSLKEISGNDGALNKQIQLAEAQPEKQRSLFQRQVIGLAKKRQLLTVLDVSFRSPPIAVEQDKLRESLNRVQSLIGELRRAQSPHAVPPKAAGDHWQPLLEAEFQFLLDQASGRPVNPATIPLRSLLDAYAHGDAATFNKELAAFRQAVASFENTHQRSDQHSAAGGAAKAEILSQRKVDFEVFYNQFSPFYYAAVLYLFAFLLGTIFWLGWTEPLRRSSIALLWFTFAVHTFALVGRIYISGRPPVTNLYSSAVFIGWACVLLSLVYESLYKLGIGNIVAAVIGFLTLLVAHFLSLDGDTFIVLQAVLDTQFWLATHVVCITLGYSTTFLAGMFGIMYILLAHVFNVLDDNARKQLTRMTYGTLCFAIFFSFIGTVLGGLWADDSWGRFWGWDPKENGALIIVLYNALVLHARWGGMVKARGLATLAIGGNIITTWSWFGVNELGVGLHAYGASESATAMWLLTFALSQLAMVILGVFPSRWFDGTSNTKPARAT